MNVTNLLVMILLLSSLTTWNWIIRNWLSGQVALPLNPEPRARFCSARELVTVYLAFVWILIPLLSQFSRKVPSEEVTISQVSLGMLASINIGLAAGLLLLLISRERSAASYGIKARPVFEQLRAGLIGFSAALIPMAIFMALTVKIRPVEHQHVLLKLLGQSGDPVTIALIALSAVISAPLLEEMLFRVVLQGWMTTRIPTAPAIGIVAILFCLVHGWRNGLALFPLSLILGLVFHRSHSYLSVVMIHLLFNATMLLLQLLNPIPQPSVP